MSKTSLCSFVLGKAGTRMYLEISASNSVDPSIRWDKEKSLTLPLSGGMLYPLSRIRPGESNDELGILCQLICKVHMHALYGFDQQNQNVLVSR